MCNGVLSPVTTSAGLMHLGSMQLINFHESLSAFRICEEENLSAFMCYIFVVQVMTVNS